MGKAVRDGLAYTMSNGWAIVRNVLSQKFCTGILQVQVEISREEPELVSGENLLFLGMQESDMLAKLKT
jgi:hypothetical protein